MSRHSDLTTRLGRAARVRLAGRVGYMKGKLEAAGTFTFALRNGADLMVTFTAQDVTSIRNVAGETEIELEQTCKTQ